VLLGGWRTRTTFALALAVSALAPAISQAEIVIGSDTTLPATTSHVSCTFASPPCTFLSFAVHPGNPYPARSPTKGVVTSFALKSGAQPQGGEMVRFRLGRFDTGTTLAATGAGVGPMVTLSPTLINVVSANLPIDVGDAVGIDVFSTTSAIAAQGTCGVGMGAHILYAPPLTDGGGFQPAIGNSTCELLVQATVQPSSVFGFNPKQVYTVKKKRKIILPIELPGPGGIKVSGKGLARQGGASQAGAVARTVKQAGTVKLPIKLGAKTLRKLDAAGKAALKVTVTFTPVGGEPGTQARKLKLRAS
jgi:hypothetical protein